MSYNGYRIKIGTTTIKNTMIAPNTFKVTKTKRIVATWKDANQTEHHDVMSAGKTEISFSIRARTASEQATLAPIMSTTEGLSVEWYDDLSATYKTGSFFMAAPSIQSKRFGASLMYEPTAIKLTEY